MEYRPHEDDRYCSADRAQHQEGWKFPQGIDTELRQQKSRLLTQMRPADNRSRHRRNDHGCECREGVMADDDFKGKKYAGDGGIERGRDRGRHAATQQGPG